MKRLLLLFLLLIPRVADSDSSAFGGAVFGGGGVPTGAFNVKNYGAVADLKTITDISMPAVNKVTSTGTTFTAADVGKIAIVRGAASSSTGISPWHTTIASVAGNTATMSDNASDTSLSNFSAGSFARMDYGTGNVGAFNAAITAVPAIGGIVYIPAGSYMLGMSTEATHVEWNKDNVAIQGEGMGRTKLYYSSGATGGGFQHGSCLLSGKSFGGGSLNNTTLSDFTIWDLNYYPGAGNGIDIWRTHNTRIERIETVNCKGNGSINVQGSTPGAMNGVIIRDCYVHGNAVDGYLAIGAYGQEGDGINAGQVAQVRVIGNYIMGTGRHGYEGGGNCYDQYIAFNTVDMGNSGGSGINPTGGNRTVVEGNTVMNMSGGAKFGIDFTTDVGVQWVSMDNKIIGNYVHGHGQGSIRIHNTSGDTTVDHVNRFVIANNWCISTIFNTTCGVYIDVGVSRNMPDIMITGNRFDTFGNKGVQIIVLGTAVAGRYIVIRNNHFSDSMCDSFNKQVIIEDNLTDAAVGSLSSSENRYGGYFNPNINTSLAAGATTSGSVSNIFNIYPGIDEVRVLRGSDTAPELVIWGAVTAANTAVIWAYNPTGTSKSTGASTIKGIIKRAVETGPQ